MQPRLYSGLKILQLKNSTVWGLGMWGELFFTSMMDYQDTLVDLFYTSRQFLLQD